MLVLALDTSTAAVTAGLVEVSSTGAAALVAERVTVDARRHGELLSPSIEAVLAEGETSAADVRAIVAGVGPGPFTGLRVGLVSAAALADALDIPTYAVCSLDAINTQVTGQRPVLVASDARRREVYWAVYPSASAGDRRGPYVGRPADVDLAEVRSAAGAGAHLYANVLGVAVGEPRYPSAQALVTVARDRVAAGAPSEPLAPLYLRRPDAVESARRKTVLQ